MLLASSLLFVLSGSAGVDVAVQTRDDRTVDGELDLATLELEAEFGSAEIRLDQVRRIQFGADGAPDEVLTADGSKLVGHVTPEALVVKTGTGRETLDQDDLKSLLVIVRADVVPGEIVHGTAQNAMTYHIRVPGDFTGKKTLPGLVLLHGSNSRSEDYVNTVAAVWPDLAERYILIGIDGENDNGNGGFNYSYVNFMGRSSYKGFPGTDRESPALVAEVMDELRRFLPLEKVFVGGHSQGGYLSYMLLMHYPEHFDGAFPIAGGVVIQAEPRAFDDVVVRREQRATPLAIVHAQDDPVVGFSMSRYAFEIFEEGGFPSLRLFDPEHGGHNFSAMPLEEAVEWLEHMTGSDADDLIAFASDRYSDGGFRDASSALRRATAVSADAAIDRKYTRLVEKLEKAAEKQAKKILSKIEADRDHTWVEEFLGFRADYGMTAAAAPVLEAYGKLRAEHQPEADRLWGEAREAFGDQDRSGGYEKYEEIVERYYASTWYMLCKRSLDNR